MATVGDRPGGAGAADAGDGAGRIPTNLRLLLILEALTQAGRPMTATELGRGVGLAKQTANRLCRTLEEEGWLMREDAHGRYVSAPRARRLGAGLSLVGRDRAAARRVVMSDLARTTGETVNYVVPGEAGMRYLDRVETDWAFRVQLPVGTEVPFHCTASGKCYLASLPPARRRALVGALELEAHTDRTITEPAALLAELEDVARRGHATDDGEFMEGMIAIAVPVLDAQGRFAAALAAHGPAQRLDLAAAEARRPAMADGAARLGAALFGD
ncbi:IclR family transcriptional regulator [Jannaschia sp. Os4]|uniref:IclR family transcriptional regulator n=1 Tax=Jannaschia sp. Os4 TaxID=2807617 RepID=UPI0019399F35|nr:IclR family transcriptional regulator [Jannaschia sp. Os4]MBM2576270.1 IclR family transcriptional regulator [Jannaschia sp. Os4]